MDFLKRNLAPITPKAWNEIDRRVREVLRSNLYGRRIVELVGPKGWEFSALAVGQVVVKSSQDEPVQWGIRKVLPVVELRASFSLDTWELDNVERGMVGVDLKPLEDAAKAVAEFEDEVVFNGCAEYGITGILELTRDRSISTTREFGKIVGSVADASFLLKEDGVPGPYNFLINDVVWSEMAGTHGFYQQLKVLNWHLDGGNVIPTPRIDGGLLVAKGDHFRLVIGHDLSVGYEGQTDTNVKLFITETFTFQVINPLAVVGINF